MSGLMLYYALPVLVSMLYLIQICKEDAYQHKLTNVLWWEWGMIIILSVFWPVGYFIMYIDVIKCLFSNNKLIKDRTWKKK
jgi:hypothetical protein